MHILFRESGVVVRSLVVVLLSLGQGCGRTPATEEMPGRYMATPGFAVDRLDLLSNGTFHQEVWLRKTGQRYLTNGWWKLNRSSGYVVFGGGFLLVRDGFQRPLVVPQLTTGLVIVPAIARFGRFQIGDLPGTPYFRETGVSAHEK